MRNMQELIDAMEKVSDKDFVQEVYWVKSSDCGCVMFHFELHKFGGPKTAFNSVEYFGLNGTQGDYIFGGREDIELVAEREGWPIPQKFDVASAINRIKFIDSLGSKKSSS